MLNLNKIESEFNKHNLTDSDIAKILGIPYTTVNNKRKREKNRWTPNEIAKIADYFKRPISYYFDREEPDYVHEEKANYEINRSVNCTNCPECISKQKEIDALKKALDAKEELLEMYRSKKSEGKCG